MCGGLSTLLELTVDASWQPAEDGQRVVVLVEPWFCAACLADTLQVCPALVEMRDELKVMAVRRAVPIVPRLH